MTSGPFELAGGEVELDFPHEYAGPGESSKHCLHDAQDILPDRLPLPKESLWHLLTLIDTPDTIDLDSIYISLSLS